MPREGSGAGEQAVPPVNEPAVPPVNAEQAAPPISAEQAVPPVNAEPAVPPVAHEPSPAGEALQAQLDEVICVPLLDRNPAGGMQLIGNCFTSYDGTAMRQFVVSATGGVRCAICCDNDTPFVRSPRTPTRPVETLVHDIKKHCGQYESERGQPQTRTHLQLLRLLHEGALHEAPAEAPVEPEALAEPDAPAEAPIPETPVAAGDSDADDEGPWPRPGQVVEVVWTKGTTLENPGKEGIDLCIVNSIGDPKPHKKRKASVPEDRAYHCYAQLQSLIRLAGDQKDEYEFVLQSDPRPKHVHLKYKLDLAEKGRTWRILTAVPATVSSPKKRPREEGGM